MSRHFTSLTPEYFESMFQGTEDPWNLETSAYEKAKHYHTVRMLGSGEYRHAFEVGCARGMLTCLLAPAVQSLLAIDVSGTALRAARKRCAFYKHVMFANMQFPAQAPEADFDLIVLSEVVYYWNDTDIRTAAAWVADHLLPGGVIILVHWLGETDYPQSGDEAVDKLQDALTGCVRIERAERCGEYRLDVWRRTP